MNNEKSSSRRPIKTLSVAVLTGIAATIGLAVVLSACSGKSGGGGFDPGPPSRGSFNE
jgi:hypothetical protein